MDVFMEYMIKKQRDVKDNLLVGGIILLGAVLTIVLFMLMIAPVSYTHLTLPTKA